MCVCVCVCVLNLTALSYTVILNGYSQSWNIKEKKNNLLETSVVLVSVILAFSHKNGAIKQILNILSLCCLYIKLKIYIAIISHSKYI